ncbi:MAG: flagellar hook protein FlgE [Aquifex sp.]|nr:MAG: flagellar hook protein FlgE [Aquifex sp.]
MLRSFFNAITGMDVSRFALDVTSDNLANTNTVGFKKSRPIFQDMVSQVIVGLNTTTGTIKTTTFGAGAVVDSTQKVWSIGNFKQTEFPTDLAIEGKALFILKDPINNQQLYTRDGRFRINREGYMINPNGLYLQGFKVDPTTGEVTGTQLENIRIETQIQPKATGEIYFNQPTNLDERSPVITAQFNPLDPTTYNYKYTITIYDSLGRPVPADVYFVKTGTNTWKVYFLATLNERDISVDWNGDTDNTDIVFLDLFADQVYIADDGTFSTLPTFASKTLDFDPTTGKLIKNADIVQDVANQKFYLEIDLTPDGSPASPPTPSEINDVQDAESYISKLGAVLGSNNKIRIYVGEGNLQNNVIQTSYITQHASEFVVTMDQDGYARGELIDVYILSEDGVVVGVYSNGKSLPMYRLALAQFTDPEELVKKGANLYASVKTPTILLPGGGNKIRSGMVEMSNVDIAKEFINLITAQRTYQANARTITVANTILEDTINLVR